MISKNKNLTKNQMKKLRRKKIFRSDCQLSTILSDKAHDKNDDQLVNHCSIH